MIIHITDGLYIFFNELNHKKVSAVSFQVIFLGSNFYIYIFNVHYIGD